MMLLCVRMSCETIIQPHSPVATLALTCFHIMLLYKSRYCCMYQLAIHGIAATRRGRCLVFQGRHRPRSPSVRSWAPAVPTRTQDQTRRVWRICGTSRFAEYPNLSQSRKDGKRAKGVAAICWATKWKASCVGASSQASIHNAALRPPSWTHATNKFLRIACCLLAPEFVTKMRCDQICQR